MCVYVCVCVLLLHVTTLLPHIRSLLPHFRSLLLHITSLLLSVLLPYTLPLSFPPSRSLLSLSLSYTHSLPLSLARHSPSRTHALPPSLACLCLCHTHTLSLCYTLSPAHLGTHTCVSVNNLSVSLWHSLTLASPPNTHTHTHTHTHRSNMRMLRPAFFGTIVASCTSNCTYVQKV
jgi:hypothetical protein